MKRQRSFSLISVLIAVAVAASACGTIQIRQNGETAQATGTNSPGTIPSGTIPLQPGVGDDVPAEVGGHNYGATLDQFSADAASDGTAGTPPPDGFREIQWEELIPVGFSADEVFAQYEDELLEVQPGSPDAEAIYAEMQALYDSAGVDESLNGEPIQMAGFVAPITYDGDLVTEFLLVPTFGACIHVPAPPPNQTILITLEEGQGMTLDESWGAVWVAGTMIATGEETDAGIGVAAYSITDAQFGVYTQQ